MVEAHSNVSTVEDNPQILVITGISGAGRSTAANTLEDEGWYVVDNIPPQLLQDLANLVATAPESMRKFAVGIDVRARAIFDDLPAAIDMLRKSDIDFSMLFLDAKDEDIIARYEAQRRPHPLQGGGRVLDGINRERELFSELQETADLVLDTTGMNVHTLTKTIRQMYTTDGPKALNLTIMSFGFKRGAPTDANFMADMRFIPNPHWIPELRPKTGQDAEVRDYVFSHQSTQDFVNHYVEALKPVLQGYRNEGKHYATLAVGCTGGKHRSVAVSEELARRFAELPDTKVIIQHRDLGRE